MQEKIDTAKIYNLIKRNRLDDALEELITFFTNFIGAEDLLFHQLLVIQASYTRLTQEYRNMLITSEEFEVKSSRIALSILSIVKDCTLRGYTNEKAPINIENNTKDNALVKHFFTLANTSLSHLLQEKGDDSIKSHNFISDWLSSFETLLTRRFTPEDNKKDMVSGHLHSLELNQAKKTLLEQVKSWENQSNEIAENYFQLGQISNLQNNKKQSLEYFKKAVEISKNNTEYKNDYGLQLLYLGKYEEAKAQFHEALAIDTKNEASIANILTRRLNTTHANLYLGKFKECIENAKQILHELKTSESDNIVKVKLTAIGYNILGQAYYKTGEFDASINAYQEALEAVKLDQNYTEQYLSLIHI